MSKGTSATGRLYRLLKDAQTIPGNTPTVQGWGLLLNVEPGSEVRLLAEIGKFFELIVEARSEIEAHHELDPELFLESIIQIEGAVVGNFANSWSNQWANVVSNLNAARMTALKFSAAHFDDLTGELEISETDLETLLREVDAIATDVETSDLHADLKVELLLRLSEMRKAIVDYRISGMTPIRRTADATVGTVIVNYHMHPAGHSRNAAVTIRNVLQVALAGVQLSSAALPHMPEIAAAASVAQTLLALMPGAAP